MCKKMSDYICMTFLRIVINAQNQFKSVSTGHDTDYDHVS